jgi:hypothetical protein
MSQSRFRSSTSLAPATCVGSIVGLASIVGLGLGAVGCGPGAQTCGPAGAPASGLQATGGTVALTYGQFTGRPNNDCPVSGTPNGVVSLTITGMQTDVGGGGFATLCVGRPDQLADQPLSIGLDATAAVRVFEIHGQASGCTFSIDSSHPPTGTASTSGMCDNGKNAAGFALELDATLTLTRTCGSTVDAVPVMLHGRVAVAGP